MRCFASSLTLLCALALHAETPAATRLSPPDALRQEQTINNVRQFAAAHLDRHANLSCAQVSAPQAKTVTVDFSATPHRGTPSNFEATAALEEVLAPATGANFEFDHFGTIGGKATAAYRYSYQLEGKTHAGMIYADENTGALARVTFRGSVPAHLFCSANPR